MTNRLIGVVVGAMIAAVPTTLVAQAASTIERIVQPFDEVVEHPCTGELVHFTGSTRITTRRTTDANGVTHLSISLVPKIRGEGESGAYKLIAVDHINDRFIDGQLDPELLNATSHFHIVSQGNAPNFVALISTHFTTDADGTVKRAFTQENLRCTGP
jgi:hypothetical protein